MEKARRQTGEFFVSFLFHIYFILVPHWERKIPTSERGNEENGGIKMGTIKRAYLHVTRKKGKSILLFFILLITETFVLTGLSIEKVSQVEEKNLREALGGEFHITVELSESNPYFREMDDGEGNVELWTEFPITQDVIDAVMSTDGIKSYDAETSGCRPGSGSFDRWGRGRYGADPCYD